MKRFVAVSLLSLISVNALADFATDLQAKYPQTAGATVKEAFGDFYSLVRGDQVVFINKDMTIMINGDVIDLKANKSITGELREAARPKLNTAELNVKDAIKIGSGPNKIYVFSDPDCPFCRQLENEFDKLSGVTIYVFPYPLSGLHPNAAATAESIWCAKNASTAWHAYLTKATKPIAAHCDNPIGRNVALAEKLRIMGTPAIVFEDGTVMPGAAPAASILAQIAKSKK